MAAPRSALLQPSLRLMRSGDGGVTFTVPRRAPSRAITGHWEGDRVGQDGERAATSSNRVVGGMQGWKNDSSQSNGGRARPAHTPSEPAAALIGPLVSAASDEDTLLTTPAEQPGQLAALPSEHELGERATAMFIVGAKGPTSSGMPSAVQEVTKELVLRAWNVVSALCKTEGKALSQSFGNFDKVMALGWLIGDAAMGCLICPADADAVGRKASKLAAVLKNELAAPLRRAGKQRFADAEARARALVEAGAWVAAIRLEHVELPLPSRRRAAQAASSSRRRVAALPKPAPEAAKRLKTSQQVAPPPPPGPVVDGGLRSLAARLLGVFGLLGSEGHSQLGTFLLADHMEELQRDGWDAAVCRRIVEGLRHLERILQEQGDAAWRIVRRAGAVSRLVADRRRSKGPLAADRGADASWMAGSISAPLELGVVMDGGPRRYVTGCGSPRMECFAHMKPDQIKKGFAHCVAPGRNRTRHAAGLQVGAAHKHDTCAPRVGVRHRTRPTPSSPPPSPPPPSPPPPSSPPAPAVHATTTTSPPPPPPPPPQHRIAHPAGELPAPLTEPRHLGGRDGHPGGNRPGAARCVARPRPALRSPEHPAGHDHARPRRCLHTAGCRRGLGARERQWRWRRLLAGACPCCPSRLRGTPALTTSL